MPPNVKPPTQAEIEEAIKKSHEAAKPVIPVNQAESIDTGNPEIGAALAEFEKTQGGMMKSQVKDTVDVMSSQKIEIPEDVGTPKMVQRLIKWSGGAIKDQRQAEYILLAFVVIAMGISLYLFFGGSGGRRDIDPNLPSIFQ